MGKMPACRVIKSSAIKRSLIPQVSNREQAREKERERERRGVKRRDDYPFVRNGGMSGINAGRWSVKVARVATNVELAERGDIKGSRKQVSSGRFDRLINFPVDGLIVSPSLAR